MSTTGTTATALADTLPSSIPKLDASGLNWAIFSLHFQDAIEAKGYFLQLQTIKAIVDSRSFKSLKSDEPRRVQVLDLYCLLKTS